jgi:hypothetical protein
MTFCLPIWSEQSALTQADDVPEAVRENLYLHMTHVSEEFLQQYASVAESASRLGGGGLKGRVQLRFAVCKPYALPAASGAGLYEERVADAGSRFPRRFAVFYDPAARHHGNTHRPHQLLGVLLVPRYDKNVGVRADEHHAVVPAEPGKIPVLRQKPVAGVNGLRPRCEGRGQDVLLVQIALRRPGRADADAFVRKGRMERARVGLGVHGHGPDAHFATGPDVADGHFAAVGN